MSDSGPPTPYDEIVDWLKTRGWLAWIKTQHWPAWGAVIVFAVGTYFNARATHDAAVSAEAAHEAADAERNLAINGAHAFALESSLAIVVRCFAGVSRPDYLLYIDSANRYARSRLNPFRCWWAALSLTDGLCEVHNYGRVVALDVNVTFELDFRHIAQSGLVRSHVHRNVGATVAVQPSVSFSVPLEQSARHERLRVLAQRFFVLDTRSTSLR